MSQPSRFAAVACLISLIPGCAAAPDPLPERVIDAHVHAVFDGDSTFQPDTRAQLALEWERARLVGAVVHLPRGSATPVAVPGPARFCAGVGGTPDLEALEAALEAGRTQCMKIYLGYIHRFAHDEAYAPVYALAERYGVPVVFHTGDTSTADALLKYAHPLTIDEVAVGHRGVTFVIAHCGNPWIETAAEVAYKNPNVFIECSALLTGDMDRLDPTQVERYVTEEIRYVLGYLEDPSKLMFGSDWPLVAIEPYVRAYQAAIPAEHRRAVFHDNAARIFGFERAGAAAGQR